ncbi:MAG: ATP-binding protein [Bdellovibrionales bacterium]|nr:ATP-binding protein [Bdellovibrionales bacterium]
MITLAAFSSTEEKPSLVFSFLEQHKYFLTDLESKITVKKDLLQRIEKQPEMITSSFISVVEKLIGTELAEYKRGFSKNIKFSEVPAKELTSPNKVLSDKLFSGLLELAEILFNQLPQEVNEPGLRRLQLIRKLIVALSLGSLNDSIYPLADSKLIVERSGAQFSNRDLSDGEYQLLMTYAIIDLFDDPSTVLLLDEMDSHVHQRMIPSLWSRASQAKGCFLTTTHNPTSLKYCDSTRIMALKSGQIVSGRDYVAELSNIFDNQETTSRVLALGFRNVPNLVVIDDYQDWLMFLTLAKRKLGERFDQRLEEQIVTHKITSDQITTVTSENSKYRFATDVMTYFKKELSPQDQQSKLLKNVVVIFDRDTRDLRGSYTTTLNLITEDELNTERTRPYGFKTYGISWHRREIENYLLVPSLLTWLLGTESVGQIGTTGVNLTVDQLLQAFAGGNEETIATVDCKRFIQKRICNLDANQNLAGFSVTKTKELVDSYPPEEISPYIENLHRFLVGKLFPA